MKNKPTLGVSPITGTIFAGRLNKAGTTWLGTKHDVTTDCVRCVAEYMHTQQVHHEYEIKGKTYRLAFTEMKDTENE